MARIANVYRFRAEAVRLNWVEILDLDGQHRDRRDLDPVKLRLRSGDIRLTWACAKELGVPHGPFLVWTRAVADDRADPVDVRTWRQPEGLVITWKGVEAGRVRLACQRPDPARPAALYLFRSWPAPEGVVAAAVHPAGGADPTFDLRSSGATFGLLVNGVDPVVAITPLEAIVNDGAWKPLELVGLPTDRPWPDTDYDTSDQGPLAGPLPPVEAALERLRRGSPPLGWSPLTEDGLLAPAWSAPDPTALVEEVRKFVLPEIAPLYAPGAPEHAQWQISSERKVDPPQQGGRSAQLDTKADVKPWTTLVVPAVSEPFLNLALGFGSAYSEERLADGQVAVGRAEFLVTANYRDTLLPGGPAECAAYAPLAVPHARLAPPNPLAAARAGLVPPLRPDLPWAETVRLSWHAPRASASYGNPSTAALLRYDTGATTADPLIERRAPSGWRTLVISRDAAAKDADLASLVDGGATIPLGSGGRKVGYAVAASDVYGLWSAWRDAPYAGDEPGPEGARIVSLRLDTRFTGTTNCPAELTVEVASEWLQRRPTRIEVAVVFFPMASVVSPPPPLAPDGATPLGCFRRSLAIDFAGDVPTGVACTVTPLGPDGTDAVAPGSAQGDGGRRYRMAATVQMLDFSTVRRWGVQVWARRLLAVGVSPSPWLPDPAHPALSDAASPVPVAPMPLPLPPGVPLASLPDQEGKAHGRVRWSLPSGGGARRVIVWECAETALRQTAGLAPTAPDSDSPGVRLAAAWAAYDALPSSRRRGAFRRLAELDATAGSYDAALPKGSTDIHLFVVTAVTDAGIESPWPNGPAPHEHLQALIAPRLRRPGPAEVRPRLEASGATVLGLSSASAVAVARFRVLATRSEAAARRADTMGPAVVEVAAALSVDTDLASGNPIYRAEWTAALAASWDPWYVRAIALPVDTVPVQAVRGLPSLPSDAATITVVPAGPPDLAPLDFAETDAAHLSLVVRTSTSAPERATAAGEHRLAATVDGTPLPATNLRMIPLTSLSAPPAAAATEPVIEHGTRAAGRTPFALWFTRPDASDPVDVVLRIIDPLGRATERRLTIPGWVEPPAVTLTLVDVTPVAGVGVAVTVDFDAAIDAVPPYTLSVRAESRRDPFGRRGLDAAAALPDIPPRADRRRGGGILFAIPRAADTGPTRCEIWIPIAPPIRATVSIISPDGGRVSVRVDR